MRTPSIYSQDDPLTEILRPPSSETDAERQIRLAREAEAKRISEQIDEELRQERERLKRYKSDVKVNCFQLIARRFTRVQLLLLGQAESGKSTLQKQFQLMYRPNSLDQERNSWRTVIYFNVVHSIKHILATLESWDDYLDDEMDVDSSPVASSSSSQPATVDSPQVTASKLVIANLRRRLSPLVATDEQLADRLSGGVTVSGSGKGSVYVRSGWQARTIENALGFRRQPKSDLEGGKKRLSDTHHDPLIHDVARILDSSKDDVRELWSHPTVKGLMSKRKLKLDEWSELQVFSQLFLPLLINYLAAF